MKFKGSSKINQRIQRITAQHLVVGIDIAKEIHVGRAVNFRGIECGKTVSFSNNAAGVEKLLRWMQATQQAHGFKQVIVGLESTGHYWFTLAEQLHRQEIEVVLVNPMTTKRNKENRDNRPSKSDAKDAIVIAEAVSRGFYSDWVRHEVEIRKLRMIVNSREAWSADLTAIGNRIQTALDQVFPEFTSVFKEWNGERGLATLKAFPLPMDIQDLTVDMIVEGWRKAGGMKRPGGASGRQRAAVLLATARRSMGLTDLVQEIKREMVRLLETYADIQARLKDLDTEIQAMLKQISPSALQPLQALKISPLLQAVILANAGDLKSYENGRQLLALAGLNLCESTSGKRKGQIVLSKRGRRQLRKYLYLTMIGLVSNHAVFKRWHVHNVNVLKMKKQRSIFKLMGKLARILVSLAHSGEAFDPAKTSTRTLLQAV
jgi:transposase